MKITKTRLKEIIKEELGKLKEDDSSWYSDEHETVADRKWADNPDNPGNLIQAFADKLGLSREEMEQALVGSGLTIVSAEDDVVQPMSPEEEGDYEASAKASKYFQAGKRPGWQQDRPQFPGRGSPAATFEENKKMKITKTRLKEIIKEEVAKIVEAGRPHALRGGRTMKDLDDEAKMRETDPLKKSEKEVSGVKVVEEEELEETSAMSGAPTGDVAGHSGATTEEEKKKLHEHAPPSLK